MNQVGICFIRTTFKVNDLIIINELFEIGSKGHKLVALCKTCTEVERILFGEVTRKAADRFPEVLFLFNLPIMILCQLLYHFLAALHTLCFHSRLQYRRTNIECFEVLCLPDILF